MFHRPADSMVAGLWCVQSENTATTWYQPYLQADDGEINDYSDETLES